LYTFFGNSKIGGTFINFVEIEEIGLYATFIIGLGGMDASDSDMQYVA